MKIRIIGDVNGDGAVNMSDIAYLISRFNSKPTSFNWDPKTDINNDLVCSMRDIAMALLNFGARA